MNKKQNYYKAVLKVLEELHSTYPSSNFGRHISMALSEYGDTWGMTDKEVLFALEKYQAELSLDSNMIASDDFVSQIIEDGKNIGDGHEWEQTDIWDDEE